MTALIERIHALEAENAQLRNGSATPSVGTPRDATSTTASPRVQSGWVRGGWWRTALSVLCIILAGVLVPASVVSSWARSELADETQFVATFGPLAQNAAVQDLVIDQVMIAVDEHVDFNELTGQVVTGLKDLGLPAHAAAALSLLQQPAADGVRNLVHTGVTSTVRSEAFADVWTMVVTGVHRALTNVATSDGNGVVVMTADGLGVKLGPIIEQVKQQLTDQGVGIAGLIPVIDRTVIIGHGDAVTTLRTVYGVAMAAGWWLPLTCLALLAAGILLARKRSVAVIGAGVALVVAGGSLAVSIDVGHTIVSATAAQLHLSASALDVVYSALADSMAHTGLILALLGVVVAVLGWALGGWTSSRRARDLVGGLNASARSSLRRRGTDTGAFGRMLYRFRVVVYVIAAAVGVLWLQLARPLTTGTIVGVVAALLAAVWILELLQVRPGPSAAAPDTATEKSAAEKSAAEKSADAATPSV